MDLVNNLVFTAINKVGNFAPLTPDFFDLPGLLASTGGKPNAEPQEREGYFSYDIDVLEEFSSFDDPDFIEDSIQKHWADIVTGRNYFAIDATGAPDPKRIFSLFTRAIDKKDLIPPYHLIYAYMVENTRIAQIFERLLFMYMHDEKLKKATTVENRLAFQWMVNTENLFFKYLPNTSYRNITSQVRSQSDATRRNAYFRMFGMDLAFGDINTNAPVAYVKAEHNNQPFILLFEKFLIEIWQAYTNARNQVGQNNTDMFSIVDTAQKIQELLMSRRTTESSFNNYRYFNLSKEEYSSVVMMSWFYQVISYDSPLVQFLRCNGNTPGERLINIGNKIELPAHGKSEGLLDIAPVMNTLLRRIELGDYNPENETNVRRIIESQNPLLSPVGSSEELAALSNLLLIINNWEKATGHRIKNPDAKITATVRPQANGVKTQPALN